MDRKRERGRQSVATGRGMIKRGKEGERLNLKEVSEEEEEKGSKGRRTGGILLSVCVLCDKDKSKSSISDWRTERRKSKAAVLVVVKEQLKSGAYVYLDPSRCFIDRVYEGKSSIPQERKQRSRRRCTEIRAGGQGVSCKLEG